MRLRKEKVKLTIGMLLLSMFTMAQRADSTAKAVLHEFSLQQAVDFAMKNNVQVKNALLDVKIQEQSNREITAAAYPSITGSGSFTDNVKIPVSLVPGDFFGQPGTFVPLKFGVKYNATGGVSLDQLLFDGQVFVGLQARKTSIDFYNKTAEVTAEVIKANIHKIYYQLVVSKTQVALLDANIDRLEKLLHDTKEIYKNGFAEKLDVDKTQVGLANLQTEKIKVLNQISNGYYGLKMLMGMPVKDSLVLTENISEDNIKDGLLATDTFKYNDRKDFQLSELGVKLREYNIKRYKLSRIPTISLGAYYNKNAQRNDFTFFKGGPWYDISAINLRVNVPIFNGFSTRAKIARTQLELKESQNQQEALKISIDNDIEVARNNYKSAIAVIDFQKRNMELAESVYNQTKKKFEAGTGSNIEINAAETDLKTAQTNYISALYDAIIAKVDYLKATGKL